MPARLQLPQVTVCSADSTYLDLTARALAVSVEQCEFADAILFSDAPAKGPFRHVRIDGLRSIASYSDFCLRTLPGLIETDFVLLIQWDGYVVNPRAWRSAFLKEDYIGAPWHGVFRDDYRVGNGGFSLRSRRLLSALTRFPVIANHWEDQVICRLHRPRLETEFRIRFANERLADRFSYEFSHRDAFGFHGFHNMWRYLDDDGMLAVAERVWGNRFDHWKSARLIADAQMNGREGLARKLYWLLRERVSYPQLLKTVSGAAPFTRLPRTMEVLEGFEGSVPKGIL